MTAHPSGTGLDRNRANFAPLTPVAFLERAAEVYPGKAAVIHGERDFTYREFGERVRRLASVLAARGVGAGDTVAVMAPNVPAHARGALRRARAGRGAERAQLPARRRDHRLLPASTARRRC